MPKSEKLQPEQTIHESLKTYRCRRFLAQVSFFVPSFKSLNEIIKKMGTS
jgi:hypothetical protein